MGMEVGIQTAPEEEARRDAFAERILLAGMATFDIFSIYIGHRLGYYTALAQGPQTPAALAEVTGTHPRYAREWLEQQAVTGILETVSLADSPQANVFTLPAAHAEVLVDKDSLSYMAAFAQLVVSVTRPLDDLLQAYRQGGGVPLARYGDDFRQGQGDVNRPAFLHEMGSTWLPAVPDVHARLQADPPARVADIGCGVGWSSIGLAQAYPKIQVDGFDLDEPSIKMAQENARQAGMNGRLHFEARDAAGEGLGGVYDLVTAFECVHDMADPVGVLRSMRSLVNGSGAVIVADERVAGEFQPNGSEVERIMYGWSILHCLPVGMADEPSAATGTVMRTSTLRRYAREAGFREVEVLPIENYFFRFYRLLP